MQRAAPAPVKQPRTPEYPYGGSRDSFCHSLLWSRLKPLLAAAAPAPARVVDLGCGNGVTAAALSRLGYRVTGIDASESGIAAASSASPEVDFRVGSVYDDLARDLGTFDVAISLDVIEHLYSPRLFLSRFYALLAPGGTGILSTPYHGYLKNLAVALAGRHDAHVTALWEGGHVKFFSVATLGRILVEAGFSEPEVLRVGRCPPLAKSMLAVFSRPASAPARRGGPT